ncbi:MAG: DUF4178 domain-containing protein [Elusimicrobia bacterium]|nr:DUF4178 domain-containing protein [Elusimicrobiota bacterium]
MTPLPACPSCGAPFSFKSAVSLLAVCSYCRSLLLRKDLDIENLGKVAQLMPDGSPLQLGCEGKHKGAPFGVIGRLQMRYPEGFWNEWHLSFIDGKLGWLGEAQGLYALSFKSSAGAALPAYGSLSVGGKVELAGKTFAVKDRREAEYIAAEGELPFRVPFGEKAPFADLAGPGREFATIDYSEDPPFLFLGEYVPFDELALTGLKEFEGW